MLLMANNCSSSSPSPTGVRNPFSLKHLCCRKVAAQLETRSDVYLLKWYLPLTVLFDIADCWHRYFIPNTRGTHDIDMPYLEEVDLASPVDKAKYVQILHSGGINFRNVGPGCTVVMRYYYVRNKVRSRGVYNWRKYCETCFM